jgi:hypothetical protein
VKLPRWISLRPDLVEPCDLELADALLAELVGFDPKGVTAVASAAHVTARLTVAFQRLGRLKPEIAAGRALAIAELVFRSWQEQRRGVLH